MSTDVIATDGRMCDRHKSNDPDACEGLTYTPAAYVVEHLRRRRDIPVPTCHVCTLPVIILAEFEEIPEQMS